MDHHYSIHVPALNRASYNNEILWQISHNSVHAQSQLRSMFHGLWGEKCIDRHYCYGWYYSPYHVMSQISNLI